MARGRQTLESWIREALSDSDKEGDCTMMSLVHYAGQVEREVHTTRFGGKPWTEQDLANMFRHKAESFCQDIPGVQTFCLLAFYGGRSEAEARHPFMIQGEPEFTGLATEGPTGTGIVQQAMRHTEAMVQLTFRQTGTLFESSNRTVDRLTSNVEKLLEQNFEAMEIIKALTLGQIKEKHELDMQRQKFERESQERALLMKYAPALLNTITGQEVFPQSTADTALIETIAENLTEDQLQKIAQHVPPQLLGPLVSRFTDVLKKKAEKKADDEKLLQGINPEDDAAGD